MSTSNQKILVNSTGDKIILVGNNKTVLVDGIVPTGTYPINVVDTYNVRNYKYAQVTNEEKAKIIPSNIKENIEILGVKGNVPIGVYPSGQITINNLNQTNVTNYISAIVNNANISPENIKLGVSIFGITGTFINSDIIVQGTKTATPSTSAQAIKPDSGYTVLGSVTVNAIPYSDTQDSAGRHTISIG